MVAASSPSEMFVHPASLVHPSYHSQAIIDLLAIPSTSKQLIDYLVNLITDVVSFALGRPFTSSSAYHPTKFTAFVTSVLARAEITTPVILSTLVYITRAKKYLSVAHEEWAMERVFLGALVCASKYLNDSTLKNHHWSTITHTFGTRDIGRIEREWCTVLDFEFSVSEDDILSHYGDLKHLIPASPKPVAPPVTLVVEEPTTVTFPSFEILPSELAGSPSSSSSGSSSSSSPSSASSSSSRTLSDGASPYTPSTSPFSPHYRPTHGHHSTKSASADFVHVISSGNTYDLSNLSLSFAPETKTKTRGRATVPTKSAIAQPRTGKRSRAASTTLSILKSFPLPIPSLPAKAPGQQGMKRPRLGRMPSIAVP
ncbi:hypothetical protein JAAARDRAFT_32215 [Jaapia argillacea MUCL 33604]|uniref:Cyclin N-terminal domain-containing protein n=1 Tax=Jaapia argillacea MUCL 33604 TaxID=933084 RepID=A0A067QCI6_9AGAM|nr:hypothetical protein JAAARDRAFT_32215 [Jaapia argillacea MUCL 33604]